ncbi:hypothetical protein [Pseudomonas flexibilis]|uniref:hypothetical protein n=1 Tax=Pseudomonas flexibilis TaxID=706570 RepID=UPI0011155E24|nr:hypothetical protein [Pseudomonas flexibilis]
MLSNVLEAPSSTSKRACTNASGLGFRGIQPKRQKVFPAITAVPNTLQNDALVHNLARNTPAMPMVASAATHKLSGFFMPGSFLA